MVYKKKSNRQRKSNSSYAIAKKALTKVNQLSSQIEVKADGTSVSESTITSAAGRCFAINAMPPLYNGSSPSPGDTRLGEKITLKSLRYHMTLSIGANVYGNVRLIYFVRKDKAAATSPAVTDILESVNVLSHYNRDSDVKFSVLKDIVYQKEGDTRTPYFKEHFKCNGKVIDSDGTNTQGFIVHCLVVHSLSSNTSITGETRALFTDA